MIGSYLDALVRYAVERELIHEDDICVARNRLLEILRLDEAEPGEKVSAPLHELLAALTQDAAARGLIEDTVTDRDLFDTKLMGALTPMPHEVRETFARLRRDDPQRATDWFYRFSQDTNYIRRDRIAKDVKWNYVSDYGELDITINLSKPEKDPRDIAAAKAAPQSGYPRCALCAENEGCAGRRNHPARQNHRILPITLDGSQWYLQYSPYVYYNEHCIALNAEHCPMHIDAVTFRRLLDFVTIFPHYFIGSNADLPIVGGSILSHDHFQGGRYTFAMEKAPVERELRFAAFPEVRGGIVRWPMSVIRLTSENRAQLLSLAERILTLWRGYSDPESGVLAQTGGTAHNTITPIARRRGAAYEMDLVLRCNITSPEFPLGVFHPHPELHHIKKENIGLIEVMGLAVLPARLKKELAGVREAILSGADLRRDETLAKHAEWVEDLQKRHTFTPENTEEILRQEVGAVFTRVLEDAGVFKRTEQGRRAFDRFLAAV